MGYVDNGIVFDHSMVHGIRNVDRLSHESH